jgi:hypothetical protein
MLSVGHDTSWSRRQQSLLSPPLVTQSAARIGKRGKKYLQEHFLIIDRITDYLMAMDIIMNSALDKKKLAKCVTSFYPWR